MTILQVYPMVTGDESAQLRRQVSQLQSQLDIDRHWLSSELDESISQNLMAVSVFLRYLERTLPADQAQTRRILNDIRSLVQATQDQIDLLRRELHHVPACSQPESACLD